MSVKPRTHLIIPDVQVRPGVNYDHLGWVGNYIAEKRPDVLVCLGDFSDMVSLNSYQVGKASAEGSRYGQDVKVAKDAMQTLLRPVRKNSKYGPRAVLTLGNHEHRIELERDANPRFADTLSVQDLGYEAYWTVFPFLEPVSIDGIEYAHFFTSGTMGRPVSSARALLNVRHGSAVMGHVQHRDMAIHRETQHTALFAGICYTHDEKYLGPQGNVNRPGIWKLHEVRDGRFDPMFVSLDFLKRRYS